MKLHQTTKITCTPGACTPNSVEGDAFFAEIRVMPNIFGAAKAAGFCRSVHYRNYKSNSEYAVLFDEAMQISCDHISDIVVERAMEGLEAFCDITRRPAHTQAAGWEDHNG